MINGQFGSVKLRFFWAADSTAATGVALGCSEQTAAFAALREPNQTAVATAAEQLRCRNARCTKKPVLHAKAASARGSWQLSGGVPGD